MQKKSLKELINLEDPAWPLVQEWVNSARNHVEVLSAERAQGEEMLQFLQVTTRSPMGAIALETGGILINHGWLRFLGSGSTRMRGNLRSWNTSEEHSENYLLQGGLLVAHDAVGGFFALNGGAFSGKLGTIFYFAPDTLMWESTEKSYSDFLRWALSGDVDLFYQNMLWPDWEKDISSLSGDQGVSIFPFPFIKGSPVSERSRRPVPMQELWYLHCDLARQLSMLPYGASFTVKVVNGEVQLVPVE